MHASELIELAVQRAQLVTRVAVESKIYSTPEAVVNLEGNSAPHYELKISESTPSRPSVAQIVQPNAISTRTIISDPRSDDRMVFATNEPLPPDNNYAAHEKDNKCFNCGKSGHWAMNCQSRVKSSNVKNIPEGENITIRGKLFKSPGFAQKAKRTLEKYTKNNRDRTHLVQKCTADDLSEESIPPADIIENNYDEVESLLEAIVNEIDTQ
ncbi:hypothetical protein K3495_g5162 [Podosphaera aphanis]|nr:hypothetical protein K3495_g5162 [Podosphaera aphanis]